MMAKLLRWHTWNWVIGSQYCTLVLTITYILQKNIYIYPVCCRWVGVWFCLPLGWITQFTIIWESIYNNGFFTILVSKMKCLHMHAMWDPYSRSPQSREAWETFVSLVSKKKKKNHPPTILHLPLLPSPTFFLCPFKAKLLSAVRTEDCFSSPARHHLLYGCDISPSYRDNWALSVPKLLQVQ